MTVHHAFSARRAAPDDAAALLVALFRCWASARKQGREPMPAMSRLVERRALHWMLVPVCDSFFALSESCLGRPLAAGPVTADAEPRPPYLPDECGLIATIAQSPAMDGVRTDPSIPHGLPGALCWAARSVRRALGPLALALPAAVPERCPFRLPPSPGGRGHSSACHW